MFKIPCSVGAPLPALFPLALTPPPFATEYLLSIHRVSLPQTPRAPTVHVHIDLFVRQPVRNDLVAVFDRAAEFDDLLGEDAASLMKDPNREGGECEEDEQGGD